MLRTRVFDLATARGWDQRRLAKAMGLSDTTLSKIQHGHRTMGRRFMEGALRAFPDLGWNDLFWYEPLEVPA